MARVIGIFEHQQQAIEAISKLQLQGFQRGEIQVIAKGTEHSSRIEAESEIDVDELKEMDQVRHRNRHGDGLDGVPGVSGMAVAVGAMGLGGAGVGLGAGFGLGGAAGNAGAPGVAAGVLAVGGDLFGDDEGISEALRALGLSDKEASQCNDAVRAGKLLVVAKSDEEDAGLSDGPELTRMSNAEAVMRNCGAEQVI